jgi:hypothetical protein
MRRLPVRRLSGFVVAVVTAVGALAAVVPCLAVARAVLSELRPRYEQRTLRLRVDLRSSASAIEPNVMTMEGMGYAKKEAPVLFGRLETVYLERMASEGGTRVSLTVYRNEDEIKQLRATAVPPPAITGIPTNMSPGTAFARSGSTSVILELTAAKSDPAAQQREIETMLGKLFYLDGDPSREELEQFVREHHGWPLPRLAAVTGLPESDIRSILSLGN